MKKGEKEKAERVLVRIRRCDKDDVQEELSEIVSTSKQLPDQTLCFSLRFLLSRHMLLRYVSYTLMQAHLTCPPVQAVARSMGAAVPAVHRDECHHVRTM